MSPLGDNQIDILGSLQRHGPWRDTGCGWLWDTQSGTARLLNSLVKRKLVRLVERKLEHHPFRERTWSIEPAGIRAFDQSRPGRRAKEGL